MNAIISIGNQSFEKIRETNSFYIDKTGFIKEWWENRDEVTLITRPRRFGKTLNMSMLECFFSTKYFGRDDLFDGLFIWKDKENRKLQGAYPVIFMSLAGIKASSFRGAKDGIIKAIANVYDAHSYLKDSGVLSKEECFYYNAFQDYSVNPSPYKEIADSMVTASLQTLSMYLERYHHNKVLIFLDEYDTPIQEAYVSDYWRELIGFAREFFNLTFKENRKMERGILTGITRVSKESVFSDLNNLEVIKPHLRSIAHHLALQRRRSVPL